MSDRYSNLHFAMLCAIISWMHSDQGAFWAAAVWLVCSAVWVAIEVVDRLLARRLARHRKALLEAKVKHRDVLVEQRTYLRIIDKLKEGGCSAEITQRDEWITELDTEIGRLLEVTRG